MRPVGPVKQLKALGNLLEKAWKAIGEIDGKAIVEIDWKAIGKEREKKEKKKKKTIEKAI